VGVLVLSYFSFMTLNLMDSCHSLNPEDQMVIYG
jgi:hypothetical protein